MVHLAWLPLGPTSIHVEKKKKDSIALDRLGMWYYEHKNNQNLASGQNKET